MGWDVRTFLIFFQLFLVHEEIRESIYGRLGHGTAPEGTLSSLLRGTQGQSPNHALKRLIDMIVPLVAWALGDPYMKRAVDSKVRQTLFFFCSGPGSSHGLPHLC